MNSLGNVNLSVNLYQPISGGYTKSRSFRKTKIFGIATAETEKLNKRRWNRVFRRVCKKRILQKEEVPIKIQEVTNIWDGSKDGKQYYPDATKKDMRK